MANLFQAWDEDIQALGAAKASDDQIEARRQQLAEHFKAKAKAAGLSSKKIYETLDQFDAYSRQNTTAQDDQLTPEEQEMAQRVKDGTTRTGAIKEVGKAVKDAGIGALSSLAGWGGAIAQTAADVGENDKSELASQAAQGLYNVRDDLKSNYSEGTKLAQKDFWTPRGLAMGLAENAGQIAGSATVFGLAGKFAKAREFSRGATLLTAGTVGAPLAYSQGYGQGKESSLDEINKTSNAQLWENVKAEAKAYDDAGGTGEVPYLVGMFKEAGGDLNLMKDLMAENAGNRSGIMTVATEPLAMGVGSVMSRGAAAGGTGVMAKFANAMNNQGMSNELARRIAAGASAAEARKAGQIVGTTALRDNAAIASQAGKIAATQMAREGVQETAQEGLEGYYAKGEGSRAAGRKGELNSADWSGENGIVQQGLQGGAIGLLMGAGGSGVTLRNASKLALEKNGLPEKHDAAIIAKEQADAALVQAANIADANPENIDAQKAYAEAQDAALVATNDLDQLSAKFNALYTPEEQAVIKAATMEGVAARKKVADDAAKAQKELDDANAKEQADIAAQQAEAIKTQRDEVISRLVPMLGDDVAISNELASLGLSEEDANTLLTDAHKEAKAQKKAQKKAGQQNQSAPKTPFELAVDEAFDANGNRNKAASQDIADKHGIKNIKTLIDAISERIDSNETKNKAAANEALAQKRQKEKQQADVLSEKQRLENTLADFAANNDHDSMVNFLRDYEPTEADKLIKNAYASVESKKKAEQDAIAATKKAEALKAKESEAKTQAEQKKIAFNNDMANLYAANPDRNPTKAELDSVGKKHGVKSPIELAQAWVKAKNEAKAAKEAAPKLAFPSPETATKDERDITVPTGMNINRDNIENSDKEPIIVHSNGQPFQTQEAAEQALKNKSTKKPRKNEAPITPDTHEVIPVDGGFAIAPVVEIQQPKKPDDNEDGGVIADAPKPNAPVSPSGGTIPRVHLDRIGRLLKEGKTVEEIATKIQKSLPNLSIEYVTQQVLAAQEKASKPATLDSVIGKYSDDEEVDAEIRQSGEVLKQFLPETIDDWKIDKSTFAVKGAWSVSYTKPYIVTDRKTGKEVVNSTTKSAPLDGDVLLSGDEQAIKDHIKERLTKNGITPRGVKNWQLDDAVSPTGQQAVDNTPTQSIEGEYQHSKIESAKATVTKTDKGYDVNWGDEVQSFTGKNAQDKTLSALKSENYTKQGQETAPITRDDSRSVAPIQNEIEKLSEIASEFYKKHSDIKVRGGWDNEESAQKYYEMLSKINDLKDELRVKLDKQRADSAINPPQKTAHQIMTDKANEAEARITSSTYERAKKRKEKEHDIWSSGKSRVRNSMISAEEVDSADIETIQNKKEAVAAKNETKQPTKAEPAPVIDQFANNKIVTKDMMDAAIARIKAKMNRLNSGFDPELFTDGVIVAVGYIESGVHKFSDFSKTMIDSMGDNIKPYLLSFWEGARSYPNLNVEGMTDTVESKRQFDELNKTVAAKVVPSVIEPAPTTTAGKQISEALDKTATAITEAAHNKVVERIRKGEEIVYKKPDAIERAKQDDRYQVEINDKGHAVVKNIKDSNGEWVKPQANVAPVTNSKYQNFNDFIEKIKPQLANKKLDAAWVIAGKKIKNELPIILEQVKPYLDGVDYEQAKGSAWKTPKVVGLPDLKIDASKRELNEDAFIFLIANELNKKGLLDFNAVRTTSAQTKVEQKTNPKPALEPVVPKPVSPMGGNSAPQAKPKTDAEQISEAMDKTAQAITDAAHSKVVERIKNGEEIVYKKPEAIERAKQDDRYQVEINDKGHAVVKNIKDLNGEWVKKDEPIAAEATHIENGKAEEVTPEIIRESLAKVDDKPINGLTMSLKQGKQWLLDQVTTAISVAKYKNNNDVLGKNGEKNPKSTDYVTFDVPNDGSFKVLNSIESLQKFKKKVEANRGFDKQSPKKVFPSVAQNSADTTIAEFLSDGEVENAYEFAKLQDKPIRFGVGQSNGKPIALAYALAEPVDLGDGFKGFVGLSLDQKTDKKEWMFIEENSRLSIGFGSPTKLGIIKEAKERLAKVSNDQKANMLKNSPRSEKTDAEFEQQWLSQIGYNPSQNDDEVKADVKVKVEDKQNKAIGDEILNQQPKENTVAAPAKEQAQGKSVQNNEPAPVKQPETTIMGFLNDGELENAYFFAENQEKPIRFTLSNKKEPIAYFLTEPVDLGNNITGFVGISTAPMSKSRRWLVIEEKSRTSIGFEEITKRAAIKSAKARLSALKEEDLEIILSNIKPINKTDQEMSVEWLAKNNIKTDDEKTEQQSTTKPKKDDASVIIDEDKLKNLEISVNDFISANGLDPDSYDFSPFGETQEKTQYQTLISEMLDVAEKHIAAAQSKFTSTPEQRKQKAKTLSTWTGAVDAIKLIAKNYDNPFLTRLAARRDIPASLKTRFEKKFANLSDSEKYMQWEEQAKLSAIHRANKAIEWVLKEKSKEADNAIADKAQPQQSTSKPTPTASTSSSDLSDEEYIALQKAYNDFKAKTDKIGVAYSRDEALKIATGLVAEMPDKEDKIRQALIDAIRENQWNRFEINFPKQPIKVETDVELNRALKRLQKALDGTDYTVNGTFNGKSAKLLFSYKSGANGSRESVLIDRVNGKFTSYHVDFDNMSRGGLKPLMDATVKWLNGEEIPKMKLGDDIKWDYTTLLSTPRHIDNAFNEAKANAPTVSKSDKLAQSYNEAKAKPTPAKQSAPKNGEVDYEYSIGEVVLTSTERETTPFPKVDLSTSRKATSSIKKIESWLIDNAIAEAQSRNDEFNLLQFEQAKKQTKLTQADKTNAESYLFNEAAPQANNVLGDNKVETEAKQQPTNEDKPKFSRKATESDSVPIYRIDNKNFDANNIKPHGLYVSIPSDVSTFDSPHKDVGDTSFAGNASPKNPLNVESFKIQHKRGNDYPMEVSAGVSALKQLVSVQLFERLIKADKAELTATIKEQFPDIDTSQYYDAYELLEVLGAQLAIQEGYDAIIQKNGNDPFNEMVILDNSIIESMSPTDKPKNSKGTGEGLTTTQTRAILVKHFGEKLIKALESSGLLKILETMGDIPSQALKSIQAWHGSPHKFNSFSLAHLGSGEGNQAYGWGLYFAASKEVAEWYRTVLSEQQGKHRTHVTYDGIAYEFSEGSEHEAQALIRALVSKGHTFRDSLEALMELRKYPRLVEVRKAFTRIVEGASTRYTEAEIAKEDKFTKEVILKPRRILKILNEMSIDEGQLYKVDIDVIEDGLLLWDVSFEEQSKVVQQALLALGYKPKPKTKYLSLEEDGGSIYRDLAGTLGGQKEASLALKKNGVDGIKYLDGGSRQAGEGNYNYVVFDDAAVDIVETFYSENPNGIEGYYHNGQATLIADNLTPETVVATFVHELGGHKGFQELMTPTAYDSLMRQFNRLVKQGNAVALAAKARAEAAESTLGAQQDEYLPYLLTQQATLNATRSQQSAVTKVIEQVYRAVKAWLYRTLSAKGYDGLASKLLQPKDITLLAERMIREMGNGTNPSNNTKAKGSQFSQLNTPQTQINAVRKKYEGTSQWMKAPNGQPTKLNEMQWLQVRTPNFKAWFGDWEGDAKNASKVVDSNGEPMVVYRADTELYNKFDKRKARQGFFFTSSRKATELYNGDVRDFFLSIKNPLVTLNALPNEKNIIDLKNTNFDGVHNQGVYGADEFIVATSTQIKSAIGNTGEFNPTNPDIRFSRKAKNPIAEGIKSAANDAKNSLPKPISGKIDHFLAGRRLPSGDMANITAKTELSLYHRTIGTQQNTALQNADFKKVYDMAQRYLQHVAVDAYAALKVAPNLLGKLESWSDLKKDVKKIWPANFIKQKADRAAVASIIFDETLNNELLSDADILKALTRDQRQIYKEARDAIQVSLENTAKSEMVRKLLAAEAINWSTVESLINQDLPVEQFAQTVRDMVESRIGGFKNELEAILDADPKIKEAFKTGNKNKLIPAQKKELKKAKTLKAQIETTEEALKSLNDVENRLGTLIEQGYAPLMRFGEYTLTVRDLDGKVKSFFMFESKSEQVRAVNTIVARYGKTVKLETDMISKEEFKQFAGMTPETMALFAKETGMDKDEAYQHYLKHAIPARSAMTRMIKRKGTEGFSDDIQRVVASFVMSNARMSAKNIYAAQIEKSIQDIESGKSVKDQAIVMKENVFNPKENFAQLRNFLFLWNLGGSIFFGLLNMTQPYMQTLPHLSQYVPIGDATRAILRGSKIAGSAMKNGTAPKGYEAEYNRAVREGVVDPQNVFMLSGVERGKTGASNSAWGVITHTMGLIAQVTESFNRKAVFIASLQVAKQKGDVWLKKKGFNSAYDFAKDTVDQTQGVYDKANRSNWANTSVGAPLMVFKQFSINYVEQMVRMWKKEAASGDEGKKAVFLMLALLASLSGVMGLPFIKDILDVSETTAAFLGNPVNIEREARLALGKDLADPLFNGVLNHFVFNNLGMDIQGRTGMPDLVPWSNALNPTLSAQGRINEFASIAGATGGLIEKGYDATQLIARDEYGAAAKTLAPRFLTSWIDSGKMALTNEVMDRKGNKLFDTTWDEGLVKFIDANPKRMADLSRTKSLEWKDFAIQDYMTTSFKQKIIAAMMDKDQAEVNKLMKEVEVWNNARSRYPVYIDLNTLAENANKKDQTFDAREKIRKGMTWVKNERPEM